MEDKKYVSQQSALRDPATLQADFNKYVSEYNEDFLYFLRRAAAGSYHGLIIAGRTLKDFHEMIVFLQSATAMQFEVIPLPFTLRQGAEYYCALGFSHEEIANIEGFFDYVRTNFSRDFEDWTNARVNSPAGSER